MCNRFKSSIAKLNGLEETSYIFLLTVIKRLSFHLHLDRTLGRLMNNRGILWRCLDNITQEIERLKVHRIRRNFTKGLRTI